MCGIFGAINLDGSPADGLQKTVRAGTELLRHRGPDDLGVAARGPVCFGHARLSIIDPAGGRQPMTDTRNEGVITYNGEIYNHKDLRRGLEGKGRKFATRSDTEAALNAFLEHGEDCVTLMRGMFAFAAVDFRENTVIIARDRIGVKPLFYTVKNGVLFFSSELEPLSALVGPFPVDLAALDGYLCWQYIHAPATIYKEVKALPPASSLTVDLKTGGIHEKKYWSLSFSEDRSLSIEDWERRLDGELREAVSIRLESDAPFGAFLSGGVDSSLVVGYMAEIMETPVKTFSIGFTSDAHNELPYAEEVARINKTDHHSEIVNDDSLEILPLLVKRYGQPFADSSAIPTYHVSRLAARHVKMALSGDGGDESFAGYNSYEEVLRWISGKPDVSGLPLMSRLRKVGAHYYGRLKTLAGVVSRDDRAYRLHCNTAMHFPPMERERLYRNEFKNLVGGFPARRAFFDEDRGQPLISRLQKLDIMTYLPYDILTKTDIASMANSLEARMPLVDHKVMETAASIPAEFKLLEKKSGGAACYNKKHILKRLAAKRYPARLVDRPKMGFGAPMRQWFSGQKREWVKERIVGSPFLPLIFNMEEIRRTLDGRDSHEDNSAKTWNLLFLEEWMRSHPDALQFK